jgi:hypothetical protein
MRTSTDSSCCIQAVVRQCEGVLGGFTVSDRRFKYELNSWHRFHERTVCA